MNWKHLGIIAGVVLGVYIITRMVQSGKQAIAPKTTALPTPSPTVVAGTATPASPSGATI